MGRGRSGGVKAGREPAYSFSAMTRETKEEETENLVKGRELQCELKRAVRGRINSECQLEKGNKQA